MNKLNEKKLLKAIAKKHIGDSKFCKKYGINCSSALTILKPYYDNDKDPPEDVLEKANQVFVEEFTSGLSEVLESEIVSDESIFEELIFCGTSA